MKVEEAKTKACPFIESVEDFCYADGAFNNQKPKNITCICGDCIAWVFTRTHEECMFPCTGTYQTELEIIESWKKDGFISNGKTGIELRYIKELDNKEGYCMRIGNDT